MVHAGRQMGKIQLQHNGSGIHHDNFGSVSLSLAHCHCQHGRFVNRIGTHTEDKIRLFQLPQGNGQFGLQSCNGGFHLRRFGRIRKKRRRLPAHRSAEVFKHGQGFQAAAGGSDCSNRCRTGLTADFIKVIDSSLQRLVV